MNAVRKRLKISPSKPAGARSLRPPRSGPQRSSHDALLPPPAPAGGGAQEEEEEEYLLVEEDTTDSSLIITMEDRQVEVKAARRRAVRKRKRKLTVEEEERGGASESEQEEGAGSQVEIDRQLDQSLETKSKQHNLTTVNVRNIIHEVITNEHVVAMMKAAINDTEAVPAFEPKMTRSKFKEVVEKGVVIPAWNISPIKKTSDVNKAPQFVDIPLAEEDSSDEEYHPDEEDEDETAEDTFQESDMESSASSPRGGRLNRAEEDSCSPWQTSRSRSRRFRAASVSMGPPPPPKAPPPKAVPDCTFLEKLHAVEEELAVCIEPYQPLSQSEEEAGLMAYRTRSKRPLRDVPLGRLEAELRAPDITPDMYESSSAHEDRDWTDWLRGLMTSDMENEEECDDEDDPEYNFLAETDEPDVEDYRDDKAVRITKKEVNELMEELFETLKEDLVSGQEVEDEGHEEEEEPQEECVQTHTPEETHNPGPGHEEDGPITELHTVKQQLIRSRTHTLSSTHSAEPLTLRLSAAQRSRLQQQLQQHVQLLTQIHLLSSPVVKLQSEAETSRQFLFELELLAQRGELLMSSGRPGFCSVFRASNLQGRCSCWRSCRGPPSATGSSSTPRRQRTHAVFPRPPC
ncbi:GON-4-like protein [Anoplopoma fimbria]|uniref:GON-4-like protein n=1 Tax=Anoplopoma fimbria TaxID=229290 RepID=UPI0023EB0600|nr:GON-4-like protein [Anoplopoma fimbria]